MDAKTAVDTPKPTAPPELEERFRQLADVWQRETALFSFTWQQTRHPAYRAIVALGPAVVPLLLRRLENEPGHWFLLLQAITGRDPVPLAERGHIDAIKRAWLCWGVENGYRG